MDLVILAESLAGQLLTQPIRAHFGAHGGTIGRSDSNTLALPDPKRHISRLQAEVIWQQGRFRVRNAGGANAIVLNGSALGPGQDAELKHGDELQIGTYGLRVLIGPQAAPGEKPGPQDTLAGPYEVISASAKEPRTHASPSPATGPRAAPPQAGLPGWPAAATPAMPAPEPGDPLAHGGSGGAPASADPADAAFGVAWDAKTPESLGHLLRTEDSKPAKTRPPESKRAPEHVPAPASALATPRVPRARPAAAAGPVVHAEISETMPYVRSVKDKPVADAGAASATDPLWEAFARGAGISLHPGTPWTPETMEMVGSLLRASVEGLLRLMAARAAAKQELRTEVTVIQSSRNNPLKFSCDGAATLVQMLNAPRPGFMPPLEAIGEAMDDVLGHMAGTMAGTKAALDGALQRFTPEALEAALAQPKVLDSLIPMHRRAKLWELYLEKYQGVKSDAAHDFNSLFGRAFVRAYEDQLERLERARKAAVTHPRLD